MCMKGGKCMASKIGFWLVFVGALNWGLVGLGGFFGGDWNVVNAILGNWGWLENLVYLLVGLAAIGMVMGCKCKACKGGGKKMDDKKEM
jgi:uncharacterized membrane protein YuzA (DUF378 family)